MDFSTVAYAKINLEFDREMFIQEYDEHILPYSVISGNPGDIDIRTVHLNKAWGMVDPEKYTKLSNFQRIDGKLVYQPKEYKSWDMVQLLELDVTNISDPLLRKYARYGGTGIRNETLGPEYNWVVKEEFKHLKIVEWIKTLPFSKINNLHCVSIDPGGFATIHRDSLTFYQNKNEVVGSAGFSKVYKAGFVVLILNITDGGSPLYWCLDHNKSQCYKANDMAYIHNDYFLHGVGMVSERRRQIRITGIPAPEFADLVDQTTVIDIGPNYKFNTDLSS